ncbi:endonuclease domain-containing protein [Pontibacter fetidus]|uniref:Endonuclease domain-containing protein n=1 Tax=Pontibacter fetidus TaxID=2700082 RepID=A0A6B2H3S5_9BACT|nr:endonuclease domain-containing protein [Pontibacter fetidus]NDK57081.1 endonuclease domain-containing protein [Pontibacter fetidus]
MRKDQLHSLPHLKEKRTVLRNSMTFAEEVLWQELRSWKLAGRKFRRQHSIENFIVDFYCATERLVIEVDGSVHDTPEASANDKLRDETLKNWNYTVLRFRNYEVLENITAVKNVIISYFKNSPSCF